VNPHRALRAARRLLLLALLLAGLPWAVTLVAGLSAAGNSLAPSHAATASAIARSLAGQIERALSAGIPLAELEGMPGFLDDYLAEHHEIRFLIVTDPSWHSLYGRAPPGAPPVQIAGGPPAGSVELPLNHGKEQVGHVLVGFTQAAVDQDLVRLARVLLLGLLVGGWFVLEMVRYFVGVRLVEPVRMIAGLLGDGADGDFRRAARPGSGDELGFSMTALGRLTRHLMRRRSELAGRAEDAKRDAYEAGMAARTDMIVREAMSGLVIADETPRLDEPRIERPLRRALLVLIGFAIALPLAELAGPDTSVRGGLLVPILAFALPFLVGGRCLDVLRRRLGRPIAITIGALIAAAGALLLDPGWGADPMLLGAALTGLGSAVLLHVATEIYGLSTGEAGLAWDVDALCGFAAGLGIAAAAWLATGGGIAAILPYATIVILVLAAMLGGLAMPEGAHESDADGLLAAGELVAIMSRLPVLVLQLGIVAPAAALLTIAGIASLGAADFGAAGLAWAVSAAIGASLGLVFLRTPRAQLAMQLVRIAGAAALVAAVGHLLADGWSSLLIAFLGGVTLTAAAITTQRVADAQRLLGRKRVLLAARAGRAIGVLAPLLAVAAGVSLLLVMAVTALWLVSGSLISLLLPQMAGRRGADLGGGEQAAGSRP
jgi:hypothetical protein